MKIIFFFLLTSILFSETNDLSARYYTVGETVKIPFNGYFFNTNSTRQLVESLELVPILKREINLYTNKILVLTELSKDYMNAYNNFKEMYNIKEKKRIVSESVLRSILFGAGFATGIAATIGLYNLVEKTR